MVEDIRKITPTSPAVIRDKTEDLSIDTLFSKAIANKRLDSYQIINELLNPDIQKIWLTTNIQKNAQETKILGLRTWLDMGDAWYNQILNAPSLTDKQHQELQEYHTKTQDTVLHTTDNYARLRKVAKGFTPKMIERILVGHTKSDKELDKIFKKGEKPQ